MDAVSATIVAGRRARLRFNIDVNKKYFIFYFGFMNLVKPSDEGIGKK